MKSPPCYRTFRDIYTGKVAFCVEADLKHEVLNDSVKETAFITKTLFLRAEGLKVGRSFRYIVVEEAHVDPTWVKNVQKSSYQCPISMEISPAGLPPISMSKKTLLTTVPVGPASFGAPPNKLPSILTEVDDRRDGRKRRLPMLVAGAKEDKRPTLLRSSGDERGAQANAVLTEARTKMLFVSMEADRGD